GGAAPHVQKKASERLQALEHPAIDVLARFLTAPELATMFSTMLHPSTVLNAAKIVLDRTGHKPTDKLEIQTQQTLDVTIFSTGLLRQMAAELRAHEARGRAPLTPGPPADDDLRIDPFNNAERVLGHNTGSNPQRDWTSFPAADRSSCEQREPIQET